MKKICLFLGILLVSVCLSGCGNSKDKENQKVSDKTDVVTEKSADEETAAAIEEAIKEETSIPTATMFSIPNEYKKKVKDGGTIDLITYDTKDYYGDSSPITKPAYIYLPAGYSDSKKYNVLYLMHGIGGSEAEWGMINDYSTVKLVMDNLIDRGEIEPFIVVCPNGRSSAHYSASGSDYKSFYEFGKELRNDLIPFMDKNYSTNKSRDGRAMAGLSMGGMQTINIGICECLDLISYFGAFSAAPTSNPAVLVAQKIQENSKYPVKYFYNICGLEDNTAYGSALAAAKFLPEYASEMVDGENFTWKEVHGMHNFDVWYLGFFDFAQIAFSK